MSDIGDLSSEEVARLIALGDESYEGFPDVESFAVGSDPDDVVVAVLAEHDERRHSGTPEQADAVLAYLLRAAAVDTGAIEQLYDTDRGFTFSVAAGTLALQAMEAEKGEAFVRLFEAQLEGYEFALDAATGAAPISESWLRQLHAVICAGQETYGVVTPAGVQEHDLAVGTYKRHPNHVLLAGGEVHSYAPVLDTPALMGRFVEELRSNAFAALDSARQAAYTHYVLTNIHPFSDGNGRVARALASVYLLRELAIPFVVFADQKDRYFDALRRADDGDHGAFVSFVTTRVVGTIRLVADLYESGAGSPMAESARVLRDLYGAGIGPRSAEMDRAASALAGRLAEELTGAFRDADLPEEFQTNASPSALGGLLDSVVSAPWRFRVGGGLDAVVVTVASVAPHSAHAETLVYVASSIAPSDVRAFRIWTSKVSPVDDDVLALNAIVGLSEGYPEIAGELDLRLRLIAERVVGSLLAGLRRRLESPEPP